MTHQEGSVQYMLQVVYCRAGGTNTCNVREGLYGTSQGIVGLSGKIHGTAEMTHGLYHREVYGLLEMDIWHIRSGVQLIREWYMLHQIGAVHISKRSLRIFRDGLGIQHIRRGV